MYKEAADRTSRVDGLRRQLASLEAATEQLQVGAGKLLCRRCVAAG